MGLPLDTDLDLYFVDYESYKKVDSYFKNNFVCVGESNSWKNYKCNDLTVQLIWNKDAKWGKGSYDDVVSTFDFTISTGCFDFKNNKFKLIQYTFEFNK